MPKWVWGRAGLVGVVVTGGFRWRYRGKFVKLRCVSKSGKKSGMGRQLWRAGVGIGLLGGSLLALRYALRPGTRTLLPDYLSPGSFATRYFAGRHGDLVYHEGGSGEPIVFLHSAGVGSSSFEWSHVYPAFADRGRVVVPDLLGFGESQKVSRMLTADEMVESLVEFLRGVCGGSPARVVALGLGGGFATQIASQHPDLVEWLCLVMPTGLSEFGRRRLAFREGLVAQVPVFNRFLYRNYLSRRGVIRQWLCRYGFGDERLVTDETVEAYAACAQQMNAEHAIYALMTGRLSLPIESRLGSLSQPVSLVWGGRSVFPPVEWALRYQQMVPRCSLEIVEEAGFLLPLECPQQMIRIIEGHLAGGMRLIKGGKVSA